jgi:hypothetical protein
MPRGAALSLLFSMSVGPDHRTVQHRSGAPGQQACCLGGGQTRSETAAVATGHVCGVRDGQTSASAGFDDADTGTGARTVGTAEVPRCLAAVSAVGCVN